LRRHQQEEEEEEEAEAQEVIRRWCRDLGRPARSTSLSTCACRQAWRAAAAAAASVAVGLAFQVMVVAAGQSWVGEETPVGGLWRRWGLRASTHQLLEIEKPKWWLRNRTTPLPMRLAEAVALNETPAAAACAVMVAVAALTAAARAAARAAASAAAGMQAR